MTAKRIDSSKCIRVSRWPGNVKGRDRILLGVVIVLVTRGAPSQRVHPLMEYGQDNLSPHSVALDLLECLAVSARSIAQV